MAKPTSGESTMVHNHGKVIIRNPTDGEKFYAAGDLYRFLAVKAETGGSYGLWEAVVSPGGGPPPHLHRNEEEGFYVIAGVVTVYTEDGAIEATPGSFVHLPRGTKHWFRNNGDMDAKMLVLVAPGGMEGLFRLTGRPVDDAKAPIPPLDDDEKQRLLKAAPQFGIEIEPPKH